jgi:hypothetical protein
MAKSIMQSERVCFKTGSMLNLHRHHVFGGANRKKSEKYGLWVWLRADWHIQTPYAIHNNREFDLELKRFAQEKFEETHTRDEFMKLFKRSYL